MIYFYSSGPNKANMDNTDRAKASIDGLVNGDYVFKLTVFDAEDLSNSTNVTVMVRDGECNSVPLLVKFAVKWSGDTRIIL